VELFELIGRLSVRDEFCQKVLELGGVAHILSALQNSISNKVFIFNFASSFAFCVAWSSLSLCSQLGPLCYSTVTSQYSLSPEISRDLTSWSVCRGQGQRLQF